MSWKIDPVHSQITFSVRHMMISNVRGRFEQFDGEFAMDEEQPERSTVHVRIEAASINTREPNRDNHLKSPDFLDAANHPYITFQSRQVERTGPNTARLIGDLTIRGITRQVTLDVEYTGQARSPWGTTSAGFNARTIINRKDWNLTWNQVLETGGVLVGEDITIDIELELVKEAEAAAAA